MLLIADTRSVTYASLFAKHRNFGLPVSEDDLIAFVVLAIYLRKHKEFRGALATAGVIAEFFESSTEVIRSEFVAVFFILAQLHELERNKLEARRYAEQTIDLLAKRDPNKPSSVLAVQQLEDIRTEAKRIAERCAAIQPVVRGTAKVGRNQPCPCGSGKKYKHCCGR